MIAQDTRKIKVEEILLCTLLNVEEINERGKKKEELNAHQKFFLFFLLDRPDFYQLIFTCACVEIPKLSWDYKRPKTTRNQVLEILDGIKMRNRHFRIFSSLFFTAFAAIM